MNVTIAAYRISTTQMCRTLPRSGQLQYSHRLRQPDFAKHLRRRDVIIRAGREHLLNEVCYA